MEVSIRGYDSSTSRKNQKAEQRPSKTFTLTSRKENAELNSEDTFSPYQIGKPKNRTNIPVLLRKWGGRVFSKALKIIIFPPRNSIPGSL